MWKWKSYGVENRKLSLIKATQKSAFSKKGT